MSKIKQEYAESIHIVDYSDKGKSIGKTQDGRVVLMENLVPGDIVDGFIYKKVKGLPIAAFKKMIELSPNRVDPICDHFGICGGCKLQNLAYDTQLELKQKAINNAFRNIGKIEPEVILPAVPCANIFHYRNKLEYTFSNKKWLEEKDIQEGGDAIDRRSLGFHKPGLFDKIVDIQKCYLQAEPTNLIRNAIREFCILQNYEFYDLKAGKGFVRSLMVKISSIGEVMVLIQFGEEGIEKIEALLQHIVSNIYPVESLYYVVNTKGNDYFLDLDLVHFYGKKQIVDTLGNIKFQIGPKSFFQTNTTQAIKLFDTVLEFAEFTGEENVYDLYTGLGSIALYISSKVKKVVGIEEIEAAIEDARSNSAFNGITNAQFYAGDVKEILSDEFRKTHGKPDVLITDPPRAGMHPQVCSYLLELEAPKIIYVSCNPATQARDLMLLKDKYRVVKSRAVDMFPHTHHIENVALLELI